MMGHREKMKSGEEYDALTRFRRYVRLKAHPVKKMVSRRYRREEKQRLYRLRARPNRVSKT